MLIDAQTYEEHEDLVLAVAAVEATAGDVHRWLCHAAISLADDAGWWRSVGNVGQAELIAADASRCARLAQLLDRSA